MNNGSTVDYILEVELGSDVKKYYHDIVSIEFYESVVRAKDSDGIIVHIPKHMVHGMRIIPADVWKYVDTDSLREVNNVRAKSDEWEDVRAED